MSTKRLLTPVEIKNIIAQVTVPLFLKNIMRINLKASY